VVLSSFVGRESELEDLASVVAAHRVVTVAGVGGVGKTRLTFELASRNAGDFDDGTWVVLLAAVDEPDAVVGRVAQVVGVREEAGQPLIDSVVSHLASRRLLLVLDNCEHVVETVALLVDRLVSECPRVTVLATSREPLRLAGEHVWRLPPLELPDVVPTDLGELIRIDAVRLLTDRAQSSDPRFTLTMSTAAAVIDICRQLDGIPLAIELVAARLRHLTVEQVAERLSNRLHLLTGGGRDLLPRQRTLRATIEWSHELLTEPERVLFRRLAVFRSRFSLAATEEVCSDESLPVDDVLDALADLVDRSLVSLADDSDGLRYRLLVILRDYALEMLDAAGETTTFRQRHLEQIRTEPAVHDFAYNAGPALTAAQVEMMRILQDDLRSARDWALEVDDADAVFELTTAWSNYVFLTARYRAGRPWCDRALALTGGSAELRGRILHLAGVLAVCDGDSRAAYDLATRALEHAERHDLPALAFRAHCLVADAAIDEGMLIDAREHLLAAREVGAPTPVAAAIVTRSLGDIAGSLGDPVTQEGAYREAATEALQLGEDFEAARSLVMLGWLLAPRDASEAVAALREAWQRADGVGAAGAVTVAATGLAACAAHRGQHIEAVEFLGATESLAERLGTSVAAALNDYHHPAKAYDVCATMLRKVLPDKAFDEAWQRGRSTDAVELRDALFAGVDISR
jgi:predicted ATPase